MPPVWRYPVPLSARPAAVDRSFRPQPENGIADGGQQAAPAGHAADHLNVGRSADRRRWLGAPLAHEDSARTRLTGHDNADLSMPPVWRYPVPLSARPAAVDRSFRPKPENGIGDGGQQAAPAGHAADHLNVGRSADRRRWLGAPLAHEDSARARLTGHDNADLSMPPVWRYPVPLSARPAAVDRSFRPQPENGIGDGGQQAAPAGHAADHLNVGRSADRRRWLGAPLAHEDSARTRLTGHDNADLSMPPVWRYPVPLSARPAAVDRSFRPQPENRNRRRRPAGGASGSRC